MKNQSQARKRGSKTASISQARTHCRNGANGLASSLGTRESCKQEVSETQDAELSKRFEMRRLKLKSPIDLWPHCSGIWFPELTDSQALDFVSNVVVRNEPIFVELLSEGAAPTGWYPRSLPHLITICRAVSRRSQWYGLRDSGSHREPLLLDLHGYSGSIAYSDKHLLSDVCRILYYWRRNVLVKADRLPLVNKRELLEALVISELVEDRDGGLDEVEQAEERNAKTELQTLLHLASDAVTKL